MSHERGRKRAGGFGGQERDADAFGEGVGVLYVARSDVFRAGVFVWSGVLGVEMKTLPVNTNEPELANVP